MVKPLADLHIHSTFSDGMLSPTKIVERAEQIGLGGIALTDHDTIAGIREFMTADVKSSIIRVPGVEISTEYRGSEIHLLGYFVPTNSDVLLSKLNTLRESRRQRVPKIMVKLRGLGIEIPQKRVDYILENVASPGRAHVARMLVEEGVVESTSEAFEQYLSEGRPAFVEKDRMNTEEAIKLLRTVGSVPVVAHPLFIEKLNLRKTLTDLKAKGLVGVEVEYQYIPRTIQFSCTDLLAAISGLDLIETGGSDYHGDATHTEMGDAVVSLGVIKDLEIASKEIREEIK
ncbi:MAG: PHP domain-containing protein [Candidatus Thorarchaeota archaeon]